jgi:hypothetical protein
MSSQKTRTIKEKIKAIAKPKIIIILLKTSDSPFAQLQTLSKYQA